MTGTQKMIFPGILVISLLLIFLNKLVNPPLSALAETLVPTQAAEKAKEAKPVQTNKKTKTAKPCSYQERYPVEIAQWCRKIETSAREHGVDPLLIAAVMLVESGGQPDVISSSGAVGLLQVMPRDGLAASFMCANGPCFSERPSMAELLDPRFNIDYGTNMLAGLIAREGNVRDALFRYGPYDVGYWYADKVLGIYGSL